MTGTHEYVDSSNPCDQLRSVLLKAKPRHFERIAGFALESLLEVPFWYARSGDQRGSDGGVSGIGGRHLVFEARRYGPKSRLNERSLLGGIDQAIEQDPNLEAWLLVTTQEVPKQIQDTLDKRSLAQGIVAISIDWSPHPLPKLAVLVASYPDDEIGQQHRTLLEQIAQLPGYTPTLQAIKSELQSWAIGYDIIRDASHRHVREVWTSRRKAQATFKQNVAGGEKEVQHVRRSVPTDLLNAWFDSAGDGAVGALVGSDGVGKTWAALDWLQLRLDQLPIVVLAPSSALGNIGANTTCSDLFNFIARYLHEILKVRDVAYWEKRVQRVLARPNDEGPAYLLFFDGLNQHPSCAWSRIFYQLEDKPFHPHVRTLISTRTTFFNERLKGLSPPLIASPHRIDIDTYDLTPDGEFDQKLELAGLTRENLPDHLIHLAVVPRMFDLIVRLRSELGDVREVTVHRLLWAYGASAIQASSTDAFSETEWRQFLRELAEDYRNGNRHSTHQRIKTLSDSPTRGHDDIHRRVSSVIDGIFTTLVDQDSNPQFKPEFVHHALGLALVARMEKIESGKDPATMLDQFLDPIAGYDDRAEILYAAVSIALLRINVEPPNWLGTLCTYWLHSQNLPKSHLGDLEILAPELVTPMLDVIEASCGHTLTTPRHVASDALASVDKTDPCVAAAIADRGSRWQSCISLEKRGSESDRTENSFHAQRCKRLRAFIGVAEPGPVTIAGYDFEIVDYSGDDLIVAAAQLLQGRPLKDAIEFFVRGAIHPAVGGSGAAQEPQSWLNILNTVDPEKTAAGLRAASQVIRPLAPQAGHHPDLNAWIASILLRRTGYSEDAEEAYRTDPKIDQPHYETDYLPDPSNPFFRVERRHAAQVLCDRNLPMFHRVERVKDALLDPCFKIPHDFVEELVSETTAFPFGQTATGRVRTFEDTKWEALSLALARCSPTHLADRERARLQQYGERSADQRFGAALDAPESMLLVGSEESAALQTLREGGNGEMDENERMIQTNFLIAEIQSVPPVDQINKILNSGLDTLDQSLGRACQPPSSTELDHLVEMYGGDERTLSKLATVYAESDLNLSERAFDAFSGLLFSGAADIASGAAWVLLVSNDAERLGKLLDESGWSWSCHKPHMENIMGSKAIAASNRGSLFSDFAERIAPAELLAALSQDERSREEVMLAVRLLSDALSEYHGDAPESGLDIILERCPEALDTWLEGMDPPTGEFCRRVRLAEDFYVALCEAVFKHDPSRGILLWRALRLGHAGINRLKYAPFMAPDCPAVDAVLEDLYALDEAPTDDALFDIIVAARSSGRIDWLRGMVSRDENSPCPAHRRRAAFIQPLLTRPAIAGDAAWPSSKPVGGYREIRDRSWIMGQREAFAGHWRRKFAKADTPEAAHASWLLFMASSDRRVWTWMLEDYTRYASADTPIEAAKQRFDRQQRDRLKRSITENEKSLTQNFSNQRTTRSLLPWRAR